MTLKELFNHPIINLDKQVRYSNLKVMVSENVAEHSEIVANLAIILALELMDQFPDIKIDLKDLAWRGVIHDWGESVTCDVTTDVKYSIPELPKMLEHIESVGLSKLFKSNISKELNLIHEINEARDGSIEGDLIMLSDRLQALFKMTKEYMIQRTESWKDAILNNSIPCVRKIINEIWSKYYYPKYKTVIVSILNNLTIGLDELASIISNKIDFI